MGVMLIGLGAGLLGWADGGAGWGRIAMAGALLHAWNHGLFKSLLFLGAGSVLHATGTREMSRLGGLWRAMPWTAGLFAFGAAAICALPPLNGFVSEWLLYVGLLESASVHAPIAIVAAIIALGATGALALAAFVKASAVVFLGAGRTRATRDAHECGWWMRGPMLALAGLCAWIGVVPVAPWSLLERSLAAWNPAWNGIESPPPLTTLGYLHLALALALALAAWALWHRAHANGMRREVTWDCGYSAPGARMQYTGGSFAAIVVGWFRWVLLPERQMRRPRGLFPAKASRVERMPETVLERVLGPASRVVMVGSAWVRQRQRGHLPDYILYLVAGLAAVGALVLAGSWR
jgi:hydrogenase-4 component B